MAATVLQLLVLKTSHVDSLRAFYECLGLQFATEKHGNGPLHFAAEIGTMVLEIYPLGQGESAQADATRLGFAIPQPELVLKALQELGVFPTTSAKRTEWGWRAVVRDPDGRAIELYWDSKQDAPTAATRVEQRG
jgi:hypothetical protein